MYCLQRCCFVLILLAATVLAAPLTTTSEPVTGSQELPTTANSPSHTYTTAAASLPAEEAELGYGSGATPPTINVSTSEGMITPADPTPASPTAPVLPVTTEGGSTAGEGEVVLVGEIASESLHAPYDCTLTSSADQAEAEASFRKGLSLVIDDLQDRYLYVSTICGQTALEEAACSSQDNHAELS